MSRIFSGFFSDLRRERAARDFCLLDKIVFESGLKIDDGEDEYFLSCRIDLDQWRYSPAFDQDQFCN